VLAVHGTKVKCFTLRLDKREDIDIGVYASKVAGSADSVAVLWSQASVLRIFSRASKDLVLRKRIGNLPLDGGLCFLPDGRELAVAIGEAWDTFIAVYLLDGTFVRRFGEGVLCKASQMACSAAGEIVVVERVFGKREDDQYFRDDDRRVVVFDAFGDVATKTVLGKFSQDVAVLGDAVLECDAWGHFYWLR
jgi:hypothetical protein